MSKITEKEIKAAFNMEPEKIIEFFKEKGLKPSFDWHEVYSDAHSKAFTVAKMTELDLLKDTKDLLDKSLKEGDGYGKFKGEAQELFEKKGWTGFKDVTDPKTGEKKTVELGTPRRIKKIFDCNMNSAYAAGRYREQMEQVDVAPYWQYMSMDDEQVRKEHQALHGRVWKADDPFWANFYPPNGWGCRCFVINLTKRMVEKKSLTVENSDGCFDFVKEKVGDEIKEIPVYKFDKGGFNMTLKPDAGWETNIGKSAWGIDVVAWNKVKDMPEQIKYEFLSKMAANPHRESAYITWATSIFNKDYKKTIAEKTLTWIKPDLYSKLKSADYCPETPIIVMQNGQISHSGKNKIEKQALSRDEYLRIYNIINNPNEVYYDYTNSKYKQIAFVKLIQGSDKCIKICVRINQRSKDRLKNYPVSNITTIGKVDYHTIAKGERYKKIE